jgi:hypothetical protein
LNFIPERGLFPQLGAAGFVAAWSATSYTTREGGPWLQPKMTLPEDCP